MSSVVLLNSQADSFWIHAAAHSVLSHRLFNADSVILLDGSPIGSSFSLALLSPLCLLHSPRQLLFSLPLLNPSMLHSSSSSTNCHLGFQLADTLGSPRMIMNENNTKIIYTFQKQAQSVAMVLSWLQVPQHIVRKAHICNMLDLKLAKHEVKILHCFTASSSSSVTKPKTFHVQKQQIESGEATTYTKTRASPIDFSNIASALVVMATGRGEGARRGLWVTDSDGTLNCNTSVSQLYKRWSVGKPLSSDQQSQGSSGRIKWLSWSSISQVSCFLSESGSL